MPLSITCIKDLPASFTINFISVAPASTAFSSSSFTALAGRWILRLQLSGWQYYRGAVVFYQPQFLFLRFQKYGLGLNTKEYGLELIF